MLGSGLKNKMQMMKKEHLEKIMEENENCLVYEYSDDEDDDTPPSIPMSVVKPRLISARRIFKELRLKEPELSDDQIRYKILEIDPTIKQIVESHGKNFEILTSREIKENRVDYVLYMIYLMECVEKKLLTQTDAKLKANQFLTEQFISGQGDNQPQSSATAAIIAGTSNMTRVERKEAKRLAKKEAKKQRARNNAAPNAIPDDMVEKLLEQLPK